MDKRRNENWTMKTKQFATVVLTTCVIWFTAHEAQAFYNQSTGRWLSRDPIQERGFETMRRNRVSAFNRIPVILREDGNLSNFVRNDPSNDIDLLGLCDLVSCYHCGEDVTPYVFQTLQDIADTYRAASVFKQLRAQNTMFGFHSIGSWDIEWLKYYNSPRWIGCNPNKQLGIGCWATVTFEGKCVSIHELNYMMYGWAILITDRSVDWEIYKLFLGLEIFNGWEGEATIARKVGFAEYGAQVYPTSPGWLAWPHWCETTRERPPFNINIHYWKWDGLK